MERLWTLQSTAIILMALLVAACGQEEIVQNAQTKGEYYEIFSKGNQEYIEALAAEDVDKLMTFYAGGAVQIVPGFPVIEGADNIKAGWQAFFSEFDVLEATSVIDEVIVTGDRAFARGHYALTYQSVEDGSLYQEAGRFAESSRRLKNGRWVMTTEITNQAPPTDEEK